MKINREWHLAHRMPSNATLEQRLEWHAEHAVHCGCREIPPGIRKELEARGQGGPTPRSSR
ncbi:MAG: hypothetical protein K0Q69_365 [Devosia sp.]|jgi:hypothetical protein|nr:hypothetical protein [Devosia sp.]